MTAGTARNGGTATPASSGRLGARLRHRVRADLAAAIAKDPATPNRAAALMHPGVHAVWLHAVAHRVAAAGHPWPARLVCYLSRVLTGVDAHPGAVIRPGVFIDHGAGVVIGETAVLESDVMLYQHVTVGSTGWWTTPRPQGRRHPVIGEGTVLCAGAVVLGPVTVGRGCLIGAEALVLADVPDGRKVRAGSVWRGTDDDKALATLASALGADTSPVMEPDYSI